MAIAIDKANAGTAVNDAGATTIAVNTTQTVASGGFIVVSVGWWTNAAVTLSSVSGGSLTWAIAVQGKHSTQEPAAAIAYAQAPSGLASGTTITATFSASTNGRQIGVSSFTGVATSTPVDATGAVTSGSTTAWTTASVALAAGSVLVGCCHLDPNGTSTITSPSIEALDWTDGANTAATMGYRIEGSAASYTVAGTWTGASNHATVGAAFKVAAGGTDATVTAVVASGLGSAPIATVSGGANGTVAAVAATGLGSAPVATLAAGSNITAVVADATGAAPPANQIISSVVTAPAVTALGSAPIATVGAGGDATVTAATASGLGSAPIATLSAGQVVTAVVADATGAAAAGTLSAGATVTAVPALALGSAPRPSITPAPAGGGGTALVAVAFAEDAA